MKVPSNVEWNAWEPKDMFLVRISSQKDVVKIHNIFGPSILTLWLDQRDQDGRTKGVMKNHPRFLLIAET